MRDPDFLLIVNDIRNPRWRRIVAELESRVTRPDLEDQLKLGMDDVDLMKQILGPALGRARAIGKGPKDWIPVGSSVRGEAALIILLDHVRRLDTYNALKEEAWHEMVRDAATPTFHDVRGAFDKAFNETVVNMEVSEALWAPVQKRAGGDVLDRLFLQMAIRETQNGWYEILWSPWESPITQHLLEVGDPRVDQGIYRDLRDIWNQLVYAFWGFLEEDMRSVYPDQRMKFWLHWGTVLRARPEWIKGARREMLDLLRSREVS